MNLRTYLRFLRPVRSLLVIALFLEAAYLWAHSVFHVDGATARFLALTTALPLLLGIVIAGAAREPMHRPFFLLLPGGPRRLRKATLLALAVSAFAVTFGVACIEPSVSPFATLGLAAGLIALPGINRHYQGGVRKIQFKFNTLPNNPDKHFLDSEDKLIDINRFHVNHIFSTEGKKPFGEIHGLFSGNDQWPKLAHGRGNGPFRALA